MSNGIGLPKPELCPEAVYEVMKKCWEQESEKRISFDEIYEKFCQFAAKLEKKRDKSARNGTRYSSPLVLRQININNPQVENVYN